MYLKQITIRSYEAEIAEYERNRQTCEKYGDSYGVENYQDLIDRLRKKIQLLEDGTLDTQHTVSRC